MREFYLNYDGTPLEIDNYSFQKHENHRNNQMSGISLAQTLLWWYHVVMRHRKDYESILKPLAEQGLNCSQIALKLGMKKKYVQKLVLRYNLPRWKVGGIQGEKNPNWKGGRYLEKGKYWLVSAPDHPHKNHAGKIREHRLVMERVLGRYLKPGEVVDHINGNTLDNRPENLRVFANNAEHLRTTLRGKKPKHSLEGLEKMRLNGIRVQAQRHGRNPEELRSDDLQ